VRKKGYTDTNIKKTLKHFRKHEKSTHRIVHLKLKRELKLTWFGRKFQTFTTHPVGKKREKLRPSCIFYMGAVWLKQRY